MRRGEGRGAGGKGRKEVDDGAQRPTPDIERTSKPPASGMTKLYPLHDTTPLRCERGAEANMQKIKVRGVTPI